MNLSTGKAEMTRAVMEGVTYALYQSAEICKMLGLSANGALIASGGGARSIPWRHMIADIFGVAVKSIDDGGTGVTGGCYCCGDRRGCL